MSGPVGVGVIGAGVISAQYLRNLTRAPDVDVVMVADLDADRAAARASEFGVGAGGSVEALLARDDVEVVVNLTIPAAHVPVGVAALEAGKHVFSEKPLALDVPSGRGLVDAGAAAGLRVACAPDTILGQGLQTGFRVVAEGGIGTPLTAITQFQVPGPESFHPSPEFLYAVGGGPVFDIGPYYLSTLVQVLGPAVRVVARGSQSRAERVILKGPRKGTVFPVEVPTHVAGLIDFESGASAQVMFSFQSTMRRVGVVEIAGTDGTIAFPDPNRFDGKVRVWRGGRNIDRVTLPKADFTRGTGVVELARAIRAGEPERCSGEFALHILDLMASLDESVRTGEAVSLSTHPVVAPPLPPEWDPLERTL
jgi:predicted dehydrogenase